MGTRRAIRPQKHLALLNLNDDHVFYEKSFGS